MRQDSEFFLDRFDAEREKLLRVANCDLKNHRLVSEVHAGIHRTFSGGTEESVWEQNVLAQQEFHLEWLYFALAASQNGWLRRLRVTMLRIQNECLTLRKDHATLYKVALARINKEDFIPLELTKIQFIVLASLLAAGNLSGRELRQELSAEGENRSLAAFYQLMARLENAGFVVGDYREKVIGKQRVRERFYKLSPDGIAAVRYVARFYARHIGQLQPLEGV